VGANATASDLALKQAGSTPETIKAQEAAVAQAQANLLSEQAQIKQAQAAVEQAAAQVEKTILRAPFAGLVTAKHITTGEIVGANATAISIISASALQIDAYVPEIDIVKIHLGDTAQVTLDPYGSTTLFPVTVIHIDPAETVIEGVSTYKITFAFVNKDERVKPGMTANIDIETNRHENVVSVPGRAVTNDSGKYTVQVKKADGTVEKRSVAVGLRGIDGALEILSGLAVGDEVVTAEKTK
jgi:HlyD family secretion protein